MSNTLLSRYYCKYCGKITDISDYMLINNDIIRCDHCGEFFPDGLSATVTDNTTIPLFRDGYKEQSNRNFQQALGIYQAVANQLQAGHGNQAVLRELYWKMIQCYFGIVYYQKLSDDSWDENYPVLFQIPTEWPGNYEVSLFRNCIKDSTEDILFSKKVSKIKALYNAYMNAGASQYDVFICFKSGGNGQKAAEALYNRLIAKGLTVFMSTHIDNYINDWEAIIPSALLRAKRMLLVVSSPDDARSPWVRSEWERFLYQQQKDFNNAGIARQDKRASLVAYADCDPNDFDSFPFNKCQGFRLKGVDITQEEVLFDNFIKDIPRHENKSANVVPMNTADIHKTTDHEAFINKVGTFLMTREWVKARSELQSRIENSSIVKTPHEFCELHLYLLMANLQVAERTKLEKLHRNYQGFKSFQTIIHMDSSAISDDLIAWSNAAIHNLEAVSNWTSESSAEADKHYPNDPSGIVDTERDFLEAWQNLLNETNGLQIDSAISEDPDKISLILDAYRNFKNTCPPDFMEAVKGRTEEYHDNLHDLIWDRLTLLIGAEIERKSMHKIQRNQTLKIFIAWAFSAVPFLMFFAKGIRNALYFFEFLNCNHGNIWQWIQRYLHLMPSTNVLHSETLIILFSSIYFMGSSFVLLRLLHKFRKSIGRLSMTDPSERAAAFRELISEYTVRKFIAVYSAISFFAICLEFSVFGLNWNQILATAVTLLIPLLSVFVSRIAAFSYALSKIHNKEDLEFIEENRSDNSIYSERKEFDQLAEELDELY